MVSSPPAAIVVDDFAPTHRSLRIAVVTETYAPEVNGVAMTMARVVEGLRARNHELQLIRPRQEKTEQADRDERFHEVLMRGLPIPRYPDLKMGVPSKKALVELWTLRRPDVVHIATEGPLGWSALQAATRLKLPVCSDFRTNFHAYSRHYGVGWLHRPIMAYLRKFHNRTLCTMVPTESLKGDLDSYGFHNLQVVARGVDTNLFNPARRSEVLRQTWGVGPSDRVVLCVGRLAPEKNLGMLITAYEAMQRIDPGLRLVLVGDGPVRRELQARCPQAIFAGMQCGEDLAAHYASADLFVFASTTETFGNVTPEAMASGLAVLAYDYAAAGQFIRNGENGLLARFDRPDEFVRAAEHLARDGDAARAMGRRARVTVGEHGWERIIGQIEAVYLAALRSESLPRAHRAVAPAA